MAAVLPLYGIPDFTAQPGDRIAAYRSVFRPLLETTEELRLPWSIRPQDNRCPAPPVAPRGLSCPATGMCFPMLAVILRGRGTAF
jgi:hypothetical protein